MGRAARCAQTALLLLLPAAAFLLESWPTHPQLDDAYISYRYAANLVEGHGLVYNAGEYVEGFTNLLWTLLVASGIALGFEATAVGHALGIASGLAVLAASFFYTRALLPRASRVVPALATWVVAAATPFALWSTSGMETPLFTAAISAGLAAHARGRMVWATLFASLATLTRPDGVLFAAVLFGFHALASRRDGLRPWGHPLAYAALLAGLTAFRLLYYGSPLPNTFYAKVGGVPIEQGVHYLLIFLLHGPALLLVPAAVALARDRRSWAGGAWLLVLGAYVVWVGGDAFPGGRFLLPALPCLIALALRGVASAYAASPFLGIALALLVAVETAWQFVGFTASPLYAALLLLALFWAVAVALRQTRPFAVVALAVVLLYAAIDPAARFAALAQAYRSCLRTADLSVHRGKYRRFEEVAARRVAILHARGEPIRLVATAGVGAFGYQSRLPLLDILGLVDPTIARSEAAQPLGAPTLPGHQRSNADYVFAREPDYILIPRQFSGGVAANREIWAHPDLAAHYAWDDEIVGYRRLPGRAPEPRAPR